MAKRRSAAQSYAPALNKRLKGAVKTVSSKSASKKSKRKSTLIIILIIIVAVALYLYDKGIIFPQKSAFVPDGSAYVHFIDVGQGDCSLLIADDGSTMLIDCGEAEYSADVLSYLDSLGITRLDYVMATHPHSDHMGGMADIISSDIEIGIFIMPRVADEYIPTTRVYERLLDAIAENGYSIHAARTETLDFGSGKLEIITSDYSGDNMNNYSPVLRFVFGDTAFLFSGDAESTVEKSILSEGYDLHADVYKAAHHGSSTSSCAEWLSAIDPDYCVIECGAGNSYGHPHGETVALFRQYTDVILRTDLDGDIVFSTDGSEIEYSCEKQEMIR